MSRVRTALAYHWRRLGACLVTSPGLKQLQIDCALIHLRAAEKIALTASGPTAEHVGREIQIAIDRLEDRWT